MPTITGGFSTKDPDFGKRVVKAAGWKLGFKPVKEEKKPVKKKTTKKVKFHG